jgi:hypothetical protein
MMLRPSEVPESSVEKGGAVVLTLGFYVVVSGLQGRPAAGLHEAAELADRLERAVPIGSHNGISRCPVGHRHE